MRRPLTLGSLFDGIGGFPLAGKLAGMRPVWASEIEPFPIRVTEKRLPGMKHYGISSPCAAQGWNPWTSSPSAPPVRTCLSRGSAKGSAAGVPACSLRPCASYGR